MNPEGIRRTKTSAALDLMTTSLTPPNGRKYWLNDDMLPSGRQGQIKPTFTIAQVASVFFARSPDWMRQLSQQQEKDGGILEIEGQPLIAKRTDTGSRFYTLVDVERLAHALLEHRRIDGNRFATAISIVRLIAYQYKIIGDEDMVASAADRLPGRGQQELDFEAAARAEAE